MKLLCVLMTKVSFLLSASLFIQAKFKKSLIFGSASTREDCLLACSLSYFSSQTFHVTGRCQPFKTTSNRIAKTQPKLEEIAANGGVTDGVSGIPFWRSKD